jgi:hypothetical protein
MPLLEQLQRMPLLEQLQKMLIGMKKFGENKNTN